ncbi:hypothetical protein Q4485_16590 [Granulosicoccaceae sp. 1_MG-2023]|nr:hypothetical protein [Granulosicoccaceae sp. 1_MG-2023]
MRSDRIYSILTALPAMMLIIGLLIYYRGQGAQEHGEPVMDEAQAIHGTFKGLSATNPHRGEGLYLWITTPERDRGIRITGDQADALMHYSEGEAIAVTAAPHIAGSRTLWLVTQEPVKGQP